MSTLILCFTNTFFLCIIKIVETAGNIMMNKIRQRREELGLSQTELGKMIGCSQQHIQRLELGYDTKPDKILLLAKYLKLPVEDILSDKWKSVLDNIKPHTQPTGDIYSTVATVVKVVEDFLSDNQKNLSSEAKAQLIAGLVVKLANTPEEEQKKFVEFATSLELDKQAV